MRGAISLLPLYAFMAWCSVKKKHGDNFTFTFSLAMLIQDYCITTVLIIRMINLRRVRWARYVAQMGDVITNVERKRLFGRRKNRWDDYVTFRRREVGSEGIDWIQLALDRIKRRVSLNTMMNPRVT
jgi:hypothetical protein